MKRQKALPENATSYRVSLMVHLCIVLLIYFADKYCRYKGEDEHDVGSAVSAAAVAAADYSHDVSEIELG